MSDDLESRFWGDCANTYGEETKQLLYLNMMGFKRAPTWRTQFAFDGEGKSYIDIGGGPCSVLLKFEHLSPLRGDAGSCVIDPGSYPPWVRARYDAAGVQWLRVSGERIGLEYPNRFVDVALIYNCLQHCEDPAKVIANARAVAKQLVMFEWVDIPPHEGHPHMLTEALLNEWTGQVGHTVTLNGQNECYGRAWVLSK
jgi:SAM-dependent methyltransferase